MFCTQCSYSFLRTGEEPTKLLKNQFFQNALKVVLLVAQGGGRGAAYDTRDTFSVPVDDKADRNNISS